MAELEAGWIVTIILGIIVVILVTVIIVFYVHHRKKKYVSAMEEPPETDVPPHVTHERWDALLKQIEYDKRNRMNPKPKYTFV